jgi:hypothetical protein
MIRGRADGYDSGAHRLDEFKTFRGDLSRMKSNHRALHWAQLKSYGAMLCMRDERRHIELALVYFDVESQQENILKERAEAQVLLTWFAASSERFAVWAASESAHQSSRNAALQLLAFPYAKLHAGQRMLAEAAYKACHLGQCVLAQAPTGIGKTLGTLFPLLKAMGKGWRSLPSSGFSRQREIFHYVCWIWWRARRLAFIQTAPAMAIPALWQKASTIGSQAHARPRWALRSWTRPRCAASAMLIGSALTT